MAKEKKTRRKFLDNLILVLIVGCIVLVVAHQTINVIDYSIPEPTPTRYIVSTSEYVGSSEIKDEDILPTFTPTP